MGCCEEDSEGELGVGRLIQSILHIGSMQDILFIAVFESLIY